MNYVAGALIFVIGCVLIQALWDEAASRWWDWRYHARLRRREGRRRKTP